MDKKLAKNVAVHVKVLSKAMLEGVVDKFPETKTEAWEKLSEKDKEISKKMMFEIIYGKSIEEFEIEMFAKLTNDKNIK